MYSFILMLYLINVLYVKHYNIPIYAQKITLLYSDLEIKPKEEKDIL